MRPQKRCTLLQILIEEKSFMYCNLNFRFQDVKHKTDSHNPKDWTIIIFLNADTMSAKEAKNVMIEILDEHNIEFHDNGRFYVKIPKLNSKLLDLIPEQKRVELLHPF